MWTKGGAHMLAKCAEALAIRMAFPSRTSGIYTHEEMHRADQIEADRLAHGGARFGGEHDDVRTLVGMRHSAERHRAERGRCQRRRTPAAQK